MRYPCPMPPILFQTYITILYCYGETHGSQLNRLSLP
jgi:hypothetical protein